MYAAACADLAPIYLSLCSDLGWTVDPAKLAAMQTKNTARLVGLEAKITDAQENLGETEVKDALLAKADYLASIGDKDAAVKAYKEAEGKTAGSSNKMDLLFSQMRCVCAASCQCPDLHGQISLLQRSSWTPVRRR